VTEPHALMAVKDALEAQGLHVRSAQLAMEPTQTARPDGPDAERVLTFLDALEEHEDVQHVYSNADFDEAQLEALA
jgi:transcriptional/translational regulatory protein YebC/TACO1